MSRRAVGRPSTVAPGSVQLLLFGELEARPGGAATGDAPAPPRTSGARPVPEETLPEERPVDHDDRVLVATTLAQNVFAVAGAGSGKTRHLVERVLHVLLTGAARVDQIAVITFTEAAAAELRERIGEALDDVLDDALDDVLGEALDDVPSAPSTDPAFGAATIERAAEALAALDGAAITTLHGFARRILSAYPFDAGLPPTFDVLDEARSLADLDEHWVDTVDALLADVARARAVQWAIVAGADLGKLRSIVRRMGENWDRLVPGAAARAPSGTGTANAALPSLDAAPVSAAIRRALGLESWCTDADDNLLAHLASLRPYLAHLEAAGTDELQLLRLLVWPPRRFSARTKGTAAAWGGRKPDVVSALDEAEAARDAAARGAVGAAMEMVGDALCELAVASARRRQREGRLQFHDLLVLAREVVRDHPGVRAALHDEYRYLFVDEYQDTDPLQAELVTMIAAEPGVAVDDLPWWSVPTTPGSLFFVGDPLQSIYAFRRADVATFLRTLDDVATVRAQLVTNFRSAPGIVEWVNAVFERMVGDGEPGVQPEYRRSQAARRADPGPPRSVTVVGAGADHEIPAAAARALEAEEVAALLRRAVDEGWRVGDAGRPVQPDDIAVLVPTRTSVPALESAFEAAGIDYRLESSSLVYDTREVQELLHVLHAVDDPSDSAAVVAALRTPGFGCGDDDLLRHRLSGGHWDYRLDGTPATAADDPVRLGLARLHELHEARTWTGVSELVARVVEESRQLEAALEGRRWREEWRRLRFVTDQARQFAETSPGTLRQYLAWVDVQRDEDARVTEVVLPEADAPAVSVMTVHAAKGLEFPVVAVVGLGATTQGVTAPTVLFGPDGIELAVRKSICTTGYEMARQGEQRILERERLRLLYVALTRAQNHLIVSIHRPQRSGTSAAAALEGALGEVPELWNDAGEVPTGPHPPPAPRRPARLSSRGAAAFPGEDGDDDAEDFERWRSARERRLSARPSVVSATAVARLAATDTADTAGDGDAADTADTAGPAGDGDAAEEIGARALWRRGRAGTALGRAVHAVLQTVDLRTGAGLDAMARTHAAAEGVPSRWQEVATLARTALDSPVVRTAVEGRFWRELYVGAPFGDGVLEGYVDLLFEGADGLEVVDYKTDQVRDLDEIDRLVARYRLQGAAYAAAVEAATGRPVRRCTLLFLRGGARGAEAVARSVDDLARGVEEVESAVNRG